MYTIKTLNAISPVGLAKLNNKQFDVAVDTDAPDGILVRSPRRCRREQHPAGALQ